MSSIVGVAIYELHAGGCITGIWTNNDKSGILTEMGKKTDNQDNAVFDGTYRVCYDEVSTRKEATLTIKYKNEIYSLEWTESKNKHQFEGIGLKISPNKIAVSYWEKGKI